MSNESPFDSPQGDIPDFESLLSALSPPRIPDEAFAKSPNALGSILDWKKNNAALMLSGLMTELGFQSYHSCRDTDWVGASA